MRWLIATFFLSTLVASQVSADVIYHFTPYTLTNGFSIDGGTITLTDGAAADGVLTIYEVVTYTLLATDATGSYNTSEERSGISNMIGVSISSTSISVLEASGVLAISTDPPQPPGFGTVFWFSGGIAIQDRIETRSQISLPTPVVVATTVPEPSTVLLCGLGLVWLAARRRLSA